MSLKKEVDSLLARKDTATMVELDQVQVKEPTGHEVSENSEETCSFSSQDEDEGDSTDSNKSEDQQQKVKQVGANSSDGVGGSNADFSSSLAPVPVPSKTKVAGLKLYFEAKAAELKTQKSAAYKSSSGNLAVHVKPEIDKRPARTPEMLSWHEKKRLFEEKIRQSKRWSEEMAEAKDAVRRATKKF